MDKISFKNAAHVALGVQLSNYRELSPERQKAFPAAIADFAESLRPEIPTVWSGSVGFDSFRFYKQQADWPSANPELRSDTFAPIDPRPRRRVYEIGNPVDVIQLNAARPKKDEAISEDGMADPFWPDKENPHALHNFLKAHSVDTIIVTGMNTTVAVAKMINGAALAGYKCVIVSELLADGMANRFYDGYVARGYAVDGSGCKNDENPEWHKGMVKRLANFFPGSINDQLGKFSFQTKDEVLSQVKGRVPQRQWKAPAPGESTVQIFDVK